VKSFCKKSVFLLVIQCVGFGANSLVFAKSADVVSAADAQLFEQSYEDLTKNILKTLDPKLDFKVHAQIEFSRNPQNAQKYEDMKSGNYTSPIDSPLYTLVTQKNFKVIFYSTVNVVEADLYREDLTKKLKLNSVDRLSFKFMNPAAIGAANAHSASAETKTPSHASQSSFLFLISGIFLLAGALFSMRKKTTTPRPARSSKISPFSSTQLASAEPLGNRAIHQIELASLPILHKVLETEDTEIIARASLNATQKFCARILGECDQTKFDLIVQWIHANHETVSDQNSNYARLIISAKIQQVENEFLLRSIDAFHKVRALKNELEATVKLYAADLKPTQRDPFNEETTLEKKL
jgi:hypothetical protein